MKRSLLGIVAASALVVVGCGSDSNSSSDTTAAPAGTEAAATTAAATTEGAATTAGGGATTAAASGAGMIQKSGQCGMGTGQKATGEPIKIGAIVTNVPGIDFTWITGMTKAYFDCVNDNGGINGRPIQYIAEEEQIDPQQIASLATKLIEQDEVLGLVGSTSIIDCSVNKDYYAEQGFYLIIAGVDQACFDEPELLGREHGPVLLEPRRRPGRRPGRRQGQDRRRLARTSPASTLINSGVVDFAKQNGMEGKSLLEDVPIADPAGLAQRLVQDAGDGGGVVLDFTGPTVVPLLQAIEQQGLDRHGDLGQLDAAERPVGREGARARPGTASSSSTPSSTCSTRASPTRTT